MGRLGETYVELSGKTDKLKTDLEKAKGVTDKSAEKMGKSFSERFGKFLILTGAFTVLAKFTKASVQAAAEEQKAQAALAQQLGYTSNQLLDYASALQKTTTYGDETIVSAMTMLSAFTKNENEIKQLTKAVTDLATAKGMDLVSAADLVAKSFGSSTNALARYGIQADGAAGSSKRLEQITKGISSLYGGQAEAAAKTYSGRMQVLTNRIGDLQEKIGYALIPTLEKLSNLFNDVVAEGEKASGFFKGIAVAGRILGTVFIVVQTALTHIGSLLGTVGAALYSLFTGQFALIPSIISNGFSKVTDNLSSIIPKIKDMWADVNETIAKDENKKVNTVKSLTNDEIKALQDALVKKEEATKLYYDTLKFQEKNYIAWKLEQYAKERDDFIKVGADKLQQEKLFFERRIELYKEFANWQNEQEKEKKPFEAKGGIKESGKDPFIKVQKDIADEIENSQRATENFAGTLSSGLMQGITSGKTLGETFKDIAVRLASMVAEALIFKGIMSMLGMGTGDAGGFLSLLGFSGGGSVVNRGGSISARGGIPKFARGGSFTVPNGFPNDSFPIMVQSGERVDITPANQNFNDRNIVGKLDAVNGSIQALSMAIIKDRISTKGGRDGSMDMLKSLTKIITKESSAFERDNFKVNR